VEAAIISCKTAKDMCDKLDANYGASTRRSKVVLDTEFSSLPVINNSGTATLAKLQNIVGHMNDAGMQVSDVSMLRKIFNVLYVPKFVPFISTWDASPEVE